MLDVLVQWVFKLIVSFFQIILTPLYLALSSLIPYFPTYVDRIITFLTSAVTYVPQILDLLFIPRAVFQIWFAYVITKYAIILTVKAVKFVIKIYVALKP